MKNPVGKLPFIHIRGSSTSPPQSYIISWTPECVSLYMYVYVPLTHTNENLTFNKSCTYKTNCKYLLQKDKLIIKICSGQSSFIRKQDWKRPPKSYQLPKFISKVNSLFLSSINPFHSINEIQGAFGDTFCEVWLIKITQLSNIFRFQKVLNMKKCMHFIKDTSWYYLMVKLTIR